MQYNIKKLPETNQDKAMSLNRYKVSFNSQKSFICKRFKSRPNHIYFSEETQIDIDGDLLDKIEKDILDL